MVKVKGDHLPAEDEVVISGISGSFPASENIDEFRDKLFKKENMIHPKDQPKWNNETLGIPNFVGQINHKSKFDARFFGINSVHAASTDPFTRILLEKVFEAIVDAGLNPSELRHTNTAVYTGSHISDSELTYIYTAMENNFSVMGHSRALQANRISYWLNVHGTSMSIMSMETSGFEALTAAYNEIKSGRCEAAVVGSANLVMHPEISHHYNGLGLLSEDGKCRSFDEQADGYARSEGVIALFLQKARNAKRIYATIVHSECDYYGERNLGFTSPYGTPLGFLMEHFYDSCGVNPVDIEYLEAEGCGIKLADQEEMKAVEMVLLNGRKIPLLIGSVKSNIGHANASANFCSLAKVLVAMQTGVIPPNLHYSTPSSGIPALKQNRVKVVTESTPWNGGLAAMNSMSLTGSYAHVLLESHWKDKPENTHSDGLPRLIVTSSRTEEGVLKAIGKLESMPVDVEFVRLLHDVYSANINNYFYRGYTIVPSEENPIHELKYYDESHRPVWFIFSGMGSQWSGMGRDLMKLPVCAATIEKCHAILAEKGLDLKHIITTEDSSVFDTILHCFVGIAAIQLALVDMLTALGIKADGMVGHSVGELGCAYADGCFTLEQMILAAYYRGQASLQADLIRGFMAAIGIGYDEMKKLIPPEIDVACHNSPNNCTISGPENDVKLFVEKLQNSKIFARTVNVANIAYHSRYIQPAGPLLLENLQKLIPNPKPRSTRWVCSSVPKEKWNTPSACYCSAEYHTNNLLSPVLFEEACRYIPKNAITIEVAPHGLLQAILRQTLSPDCTNIALTRRKHPQGLRFLLTGIGKLYLKGLTLEIKELYPPVQLPVSRGTPSISPLVSWDHTDTLFTVGDSDQTEFVSAVRKVSVSLNQEEFRACAGHVINGCTVLPAFAYLKIVWDIIAAMQGTTFNKVPVVFQDVRFIHYLHIEERGSETLHVLVQRGSGDFEISSENELLVTGNARVPDNIEKVFVQQPSMPNGDIVLTGDDFYVELEKKRYQYSDPFRGVQHLTFGDEGSVAKVQWSNNWIAFGEALLQVMMFQSIKCNNHLQVPAALQKIVINPLQSQVDTHELEAVFHNTTGVIRCGEMELVNVRTKPFFFLTSVRPELKLEAIRFVTYHNPSFETIQQFIAMALHLMIENSHSGASVTVMDSTAVNMLMHIKSLLPQYPQITVKNFDPEESHNLIVVTRSNELKSATALLTHGGFLLISMHDNNLSLSSDFTMIAEKLFGNEKLSLFRKVVLPNMYTSSVLHLKTNTSTWLHQIKMSESTYRLYVVAELDLQNVKNILSFIQGKNKEPGLKHVRYVLILDKEAPVFALNERLYYEQLHHDLLVNIFYNGQWGTFSHIPIDIHSTDDTESTESKIQSFQSLEDVKMVYLGPNLKDLSVLDTENRPMPSELGSLEFSGYSGTGQRLMGVVKWRSKSYFKWNVPESWTLEEAVTVPLAYTTAYLSLILRAEMKRGEKVLIHAGWSSIGQAAIAVALDYDCTVFTTVANQEQRSFIKQHIPQLPGEHIYSCEDISFETCVLRATNGEGVNIIINNFSGSKLHASIRCLAPYGRLIQLGKNDDISNQTIGMNTFLKSTAVFGVITENLFNITPEWKEALHSGIQSCLQRGVIKPLKCTVFPKQQTKMALRTLADMNQMHKVVLNMVTGNTSSFSKTMLECSSQRFYLVVGEKVDQCLDVAEWLTSHGVSQVIITVGIKTIPKHIELKIGFLNSRYGTKMVLLSSSSPNTLSSSQQLLKQAFSRCEGNLAGVFILPLEPSDHEDDVTTAAVKSLDLATRSITTVRHFVCLLTEKGWSTCEARHRAGFPALTVTWQQHRNKNFNFLWSLNVLDTLFTRKTEDPIVIISEAQKDCIKSCSAIPTLDTFLPSSMKNLASFGKDLISGKCNLSWIVELPSLSPGHGKMKEVPPVFLIPGLQGSPCEILKSLTMKLIYPAMCIKFVQPFTSIPEIAASMVKYVQEKQNMGPYNLVGISWGGAITLELARQLEARGHSTRVILIDGAPETTQAAVRCLENEDKFDLNLVSRLLHIPESKVTNSWSALLADSLKEVPLTVKPFISNALTTLRSCLSELLNYKPTGELLKGEISLVRPSDGNEDDNCGLDQFVKHTVNIHITEGNHFTILENPNTARIINDFIL